jgi:hypothetical protein
VAAGGATDRELIEALHVRTKLLTCVIALISKVGTPHNTLDLTAADWRLLENNTATLGEIGGLGADGSEQIGVTQAFVTQALGTRSCALSAV